MKANLEHYRFFYHVAAEGGITAAASVLFVSQPAVSKAIKQLEASLDCELFFRGAKGMTLTPEGQILYQYVSRAFEQLALGEYRVEEMINMHAGTVRIGSSDMLSRFFILPYLEAFHRECPDIRITVQNGTTPDMEQALEDERVAIAVVTSPVELSEGFRVTEIAPIHDIFVGGSRYRALSNAVQPLASLLELPTICTEKSTATRQYLDQFFRKHRLKLAPSFELGTIELIPPYVLKNFGVGIVIRECVSDLLDQGDLVEIPTDIQIPPRKICVITKKNGHVSRAERTFLNLLKENGGLLRS